MKNIKMDLSPALASPDSPLLALKPASDPSFNVNSPPFQIHLRDSELGVRPSKLTSLLEKPSGCFQINPLRRRGSAAAILQPTLTKRRRTQPLLSPEEVSDATALNPSLGFLAALVNREVERLDSRVFRNTISHVLRQLPPPPVSKNSTARSAPKPLPRAPLRGANGLIKMEVKDQRKASQVQARMIGGDDGVRGVRGVRGQAQGHGVDGVRDEESLLEELSRSPPNGFASVSDVMAYLKSPEEAEFPTSFMSVSPASFPLTP